MPIDITSEDLVPLAQAARELPSQRQGRPVHVATLHRWANRGIRGIRLETIRIGGTVNTSRQALQRFFEATSQAAGGEGESPNPPASLTVSRQREREAAATRVHEKLFGSA